MTRPSRLSILLAALLAAISSGSAFAQTIGAMRAPIGWVAGMTKFYETFSAETLNKTFTDPAGRPLFDLAVPLERARLWTLYSKGLLVPEGVPLVRHPAAGTPRASVDRNQADYLIREQLLASAAAIREGKLDHDNEERAKEDVLFADYVAAALPFNHDVEVVRQAQMVALSRAYGNSRRAMARIRAELIPSGDVR
ncbi:MAG: hypothetical protein HY925_08215 [Elusimicrobia bacterium]|nr:hypothetical protein [Elusimicrobiota bacterium]